MQKGEGSLRRTGVRGRDERSEQQRLEAIKLDRVGIDAVGEHVHKIAANEKKEEKKEPVQRNHK